MIDTGKSMSLVSYTKYQMSTVSLSTYHIKNTFSAIWCPLIKAKDDTLYILIFFSVKTIVAVAVAVWHHGVRVSANGF